jgi:hypothetical protein
MVINSRVRTGYLWGSLGALWVIDGLLQLQPRMFTRSFSEQVLSPSAVGQPGFVSGPMDLVVKIILTHPAFFDAVFALIQLSIGLLILNKDTRRYGLIASIIWGLLVWYCAEGLGGILSPGSILLNGAPGAALLYAVISFALLSRESKEDRLPSWLNYAWAGLWLGGIILLFNAGSNGNSLAILLITLILYSLAGSLVFFGPGLRKAAVYLGILLALYIWIHGENFGYIFSGLATDPNSGPLIILLGLAVLESPPVSLDVV